MSRIRRLIEQAIEIVGSEAKLGRAAKFSQQAIWKAKKIGRVSPRMAKSIDRATKGKIPRTKLRPDIFA